MYRMILKFTQNIKKFVGSRRDKDGGHVVGNLCCISNGRRNIFRGGRQSEKSSF
jgi:hypothetical protein